MDAYITLLLLGLGCGIADRALGARTRSDVSEQRRGELRHRRDRDGLLLRVLGPDRRTHGGRALLAGIVAVLFGAAAGRSSATCWSWWLPRDASNLTRVIATLAVLIILESGCAAALRPQLAGGQSLPTRWLGQLRRRDLRSRQVSSSCSACRSCWQARSPWIYARTIFGVATTALVRAARTSWRLIGLANRLVGSRSTGASGVHCLGWPACFWPRIIGVSIDNGYVADRHDPGGCADRRAAFIPAHPASAAWSSGCCSRCSASTTWACPGLPTPSHSWRSSA